MLFGREGQVQHGQSEHHLREVVRSFGEVHRAEFLALARIELGVVPPEGIHGDQVRALLVDGQVVVVVLRPLLCLVELAVELTSGLAQVAIGTEEESAVSVRVLTCSAIQFLHLLPLPVSEWST